MKVFAETDIGRARELNEDFYYIDEAEGIYILADGMGGYNGGEIASKIAATVAFQYIQHRRKKTMQGNQILELIKEAIEYANMIVYEKSQEERELSEMGTTLDVILIKDGKRYIGHVGDSRIYLIRNNEIKKITNDHSYVEKLIKDGKITRAEAEVHPDKNMLMKAIGSSNFVSPDLVEEEFQDGDILLMCSDGLTNMVKEEEILQIILEKENTKAESLIQKANEKGGHDNITVVMIENN